MSAWAHPLSLTSNPPQVIPSHPPGFNPLPHHGVCPRQHGHGGGPACCAEGSLGLFVFGFKTLILLAGENF